MLERIPEKRVVINAGNKQILDSLEKALIQNGLGDIQEDKAVKSELIADNSKDRKGLSIHILKIGEMVTGNAMGAREKNFPEILIALDPDPYELRDSYVSYLNKLIRKQGITPAETNQNLIQSPYVLVREILIRLCSVALCIDNDLKRDGAKIINALIDFQSLLINSHVLDTPSILGNIFKGNQLSEFSKAFATTHLQWNNFLKEMVKTTAELHANIKIVTDTLSNLIKWEKIIKRHLIVRICLSGSLKFEAGCLSPTWINDTLTKYENEIIEKNSEIKNHCGLNENETNLISLNIVEKSQFDNQNRIMRILQKTKSLHADKIKKLYHVFIQTRLTLSIFNSLHSLLLIGGWIPIMMGSINLKNISLLLTNYLSECEIALKIDDEDSILKGEIGYEFGQYQVDISKLQDMTITCSDSLIKLRDSKLLMKLKQRVEANIIQLNSLEKITGVKMINTLETNATFGELMLKNENSQSGGIPLTQSPEIKPLSPAAIIASGSTNSPLNTPKKISPEEEAKALMQKAITADSVEESIVYLNRLIDDLNYDHPDHLYLRATYYMARNYWNDASRDVNKILLELPDHKGANEMMIEIRKMQAELSISFSSNK